MTSDLAAALQRQCIEQRERCLWTSTSLFIWLRRLRFLRILFIVVPIILGTFASWDLLQGDGVTLKVMTAVCALLAGLIPAIYAALKLEEHLPTAARLAGEYKNLEILFADLSQCGPPKAIDLFEAEYKLARDRLEAANAAAYTAPESCLRAARKKIEGGHYSLGK